jgi:hypothetical protein
MYVMYVVSISAFVGYFDYKNMHSVNNIRVQFTMVMSLLHFFALEIKYTV